MKDHQIQRKAEEYIRFMKIGKRGDGERIIYIQGHAPADLTRLIDHSLGAFQADKYRYSFIFEILSTIARCKGDPEQIEPESDWNCSNLLHWLHSHPSRFEYLKRATTNAIDQESLAPLAVAQYLEKLEVLNLIIQKLKEDQEEEKADSKVHYLNLPMELHAG